MCVTEYSLGAIFIKKLIPQKPIDVFGSSAQRVNYVHSLSRLVSCRLTSTTLWSIKLIKPFTHFFKQRCVHK